MSAKQSAYFEPIHPISQIQELGVNRPAKGAGIPGTLPVIWREKPEVIHKFLARQGDYQQLCQEVAYVLRKRLAENSIEYSSISYRAKDLQSFLDKIERKNYEDPFGEITDFAGVRVVCLYPSDLDRIERLIRHEFDMVEKVDKYKENSLDRFGYMAVHFLVRLGEEFSGARYDNLKTLTCEIQLRTILQHAWAQIDQHLVYKTKKSVPENIRRQINELSKVLEEADRQFEMIRSKRADYIRQLEMDKSKDAFWSQEVNLDSFRIFCEREFPDAPREDDPAMDNKVLKWLHSSNYYRTGMLRETVTKARPKLDRAIREMDRLLSERKRPPVEWTDLYLVHASLAIADMQYREIAGASSEFQEVLDMLDQG